jgi:hypothetical protein
VTDPVQIRPLLQQYYFIVFKGGEMAEKEER